jgi:pheromone shutdown-related protein TraB
VTESTQPAIPPEPPAAAQADPDQPVREVVRDGVHYTLLGTAHVSPASVRAVEAQVAGFPWDAVAVELCSTRLEALDGKKSWQDLDLFQIIRSGKAGLVMANLALSGYQRRIAEQFDIEPGAELKAAAMGARERGLALQLVDRDLATTLRRTYQAVPWYKRFYLTTGLVMSSFSSEEIDEEAIEKLKEGDILESTFTEFAEQSPELYEALIAERDRYMAARLREENSGRDGDRVLVVVGAGHLDGLARHLAEDPADASEIARTLAEQPPKARWPRTLPWVITALVLTGFYFGFSRSPELGWQLVGVWVLLNGGLAALGAALARGHPLTILSAMLAAPLTSLNPAVAAGMVAGAVESVLKKPTGHDLERLREDATSLKGWYRNPATRILLVFFLANLGSSLGTWIAGFRFFQLLT